ncbi:uncharacterized protein N7511_004840 [Penicillium nucicola]|uniref:uncharacterized protein n=1 Tax=Penicillium nucicola TaxID=1850975 RepID=UPI002544F559|nr:uncharacterized protein N7511_004840 [Penicillium nucicola]KAJ5767224.1 hypothetical protein N7511_004840 [Penicillium nucicola]
MLFSAQILPYGLFVGFLALTLAVGATQYDCRCFPRDECWPSPLLWSAFNTSIDGRLIETNPLASSCHAPSYNAQECSKLKEDWLLPDQQASYDSSSSIMAPFFTNGTCDPYHPVSKKCTLGNLIHYAVNVSRPEHVSKTLKFATTHNIRLVVRNTGHDYNGKSTGAGALGLWMQNIKGIEFKDYHDMHYTGKVAKFGAGVQGTEAYTAATAQGLEIVGGECASVGIAGGYSQGGGHSALSSRHGLAADQVIEWEVIDGTGRFLVASREQNRDLYWALSGGGGGTYGVVWSMTSKAYTSTPASGLNLTFTSEGVSKDTYYEAAKLYYSMLPGIVDMGIMSLAYLTNTSFSIAPMTGPNISAKDLESLVQPFRNRLDNMAINYTFYAGQFDSYLDEFENMMKDAHIGTAQYGSWLIPRSVVQNKNDDLIEAARYIAEDGAKFATFALNVSHKVSGNVYNSVLPAWREAIFHGKVSTTWEFNQPDKMRDVQEKMTTDYVPRLQKLAPESGAYLNEADFRQPDFQKSFYGTNYNALRQVKAKYDPHDVFYGLTAVGSDDWTVSDNGRMCRVNGVKSL